MLPSSSQQSDALLKTVNKTVTYGDKLTDTLYSGRLSNGMLAAGMVTFSENNLTVFGMFTL